MNKKKVERELKKKGQMLYVKKRVIRREIFLKNKKKE